MHTTIRLAVTLTGWLALAAPAPAADLAAAVDAALQRWPQRALSAAVQRQGEAIRAQADSLLADDPAVVLRHENDTYTDSNGFRSWEGGLGLPLWLPGQRERRRQVAGATSREAHGIQRLQHWRVAGEVRELLWSVQIAATELALAGQAVDSARVLEDDVDKRYRAGELARTDLILAQKELLQRQTEQVAAQAVLDSRRQQYRLWTGLPELPADISEPAAAAADIDADHPALVAARLSTALARSRRDQVQGEKHPNPILTLGGKSERPAAGADYDTALVVELELPLGTSGRAEVKTADAERSLTEAAAELARVERELQSDLQRTRVERDSAARALQLAEQQQALTGEGLRLTQRAFELGESDLFTLLQARAQALSAERDARLRRLELGRATARYNQALGVLPQ